MRDANLREEAKEKWAGPLGEKLRGLSNGLLPIKARMDRTQQKIYTVIVETHTEIILLSHKTHYKVYGGVCICVSI